RALSFYEAIRKYWPGLPDNILQPDYCGIRPKIYESTDFMISTPADHGTSGLFNLYGIESPGLTSSLAIGEYVKQQLTRN
ncbi:MAG: FAD-dependent oxidoreductase, partial [Pseudomonadota bacterium]